MHRSINDRIVVKRHFGATVSTTQTPSTGVDLKGLRTAEIVVDVGAVTNIAASPQPSWALSLEHSDAAASGFANVVDADVTLNSGNNDGAISSGVFATVDDATKDDRTYRLGYIGGKRYVRVVATAAATPGATPIYAAVVGEPLLQPGTDV